MKPRTVHGLKGLAIERSTQIALERAKADPSDAPLFAKMANSLKYLGEDMRAGVEWARAAVSVVRTAQGYDPALHGATDDEIADIILAKVDERMMG
jgi:hypothetical protein